MAFKATLGFTLQKMGECCECAHKQQQSNQCAAIGQIADAVARIDVAAHDASEDQRGHNGQETTCRDDENRVATVMKSSTDAGEQRGRFTVALEFRPRFELENNAREQSVEFRHRYASASAIRVVEINLVAPEAFDHEPMIEVPKGDKRQLAFREAFTVHAPTGSGQPITLGSAQDVASLAAIAGDATRGAQFFQRNMSSVIGEDHAEGSSATFGRFHLDDRRSPASHADSVGA